jgi:drug/metabolite transporter (DMT)-like permease
MLVGAALTFSTGGAVIKAIGLPTLQIAGLRSVVAFVAMLAMVPDARRGWSLRVAPVAIGYAAMMFCFVSANKLTTAANAIFLQSTFPLWVVVLSPWLLGERVRGRDLGALAVMAGGAALLASGEERATAVATDPALGNAFAVASGLFWGLTVLGIRWLSRDGSGSAVTATAAGSLVAAIGALGVGGLPASVGAGDVVGLLWLGVVQIALSYVLMAAAMRRLDAMESTLWLLVEPAVVPLWAWLAHGEVPTSAALGGGALIVAALALRALLARGGAADPERPDRPERPEPGRG